MFKLLFFFRQKYFGTQILVLLIALSFLGCEVRSVRPELASEGQEESADQGAALNESYSLTKDRAELEEIRKNIPEEARKENDESALFAEWMSEVKLTPSEVRSKFDSLYRKKRNLFEKDIKTERENFKKGRNREKKEFERQEKIKKQEAKEKRHSREEQKAKLSEISDNRRDFFSSQKEKRDDFEYRVRERRKEFEDYIKARRGEFDQEWRSYSKRFMDQKKVEKDAKGKN